MDVGPQHEVVHNQKQDVEMINVAQQSQETTTEYQAEIQDVDHPKLQKDKPNYSTTSSNDSVLKKMSRKKHWI